MILTDTGPLVALINPAFRLQNSYSGYKTVARPQNRRSGESRNPESSGAGPFFSGGFPGFRLSPERRL